MRNESVHYRETLKDKECGKEIYQRKDGLYSARYYDKTVKCKKKYFETLPEAKNWLADARYKERHCIISFVILLRTRKGITRSIINGISSP